MLTGFPLNEGRHTHTHSNTHRPTQTRSTVTIVTLVSGFQEDAEGEMTEGPSYLTYSAVGPTYSLAQEPQFREMYNVCNPS